MTTEVEAKLSVSEDFLLPFDRLSQLGFEIETRPVQMTSTRYFDSGNLALMSCGAAIRFRETSGRSKPGQGLWTLKFSPPQHSHVTARDEYETWGIETEVPARFGPAFRVFGCEAAAMATIAALDAQRRSSILTRAGIGPVLRVDDDLVEVRLGTNFGSRFREIEVELAQSDALGDMYSVVNVLVDAGATPAQVSSKLEQALVGDGAQLYLEEGAMKDPGLAADLCSIARFVLDAGADDSPDLLKLVERLLCDLTDRGIVSFLEVMLTLASSGNHIDEGEIGLAEVISAKLSLFITTTQGRGHPRKISPVVRNQIELLRASKGIEFLGPLAEMTMNTLIGIMLGELGIDLENEVLSFVYSQ